MVNKKVLIAVFAAFLVLALLYYFFLRGPTWIFAQGLDSTGDHADNIISPPPSMGDDQLSIPEMKKLCLATVGCVGFNTNGWYKRDLLPIEDWRRWTTEDQPDKGFWYLSNATFTGLPRQ